jgi:NAD(P)-dependent dehydrogenase (short-subunit alcohol dehydrogenase family)
LGERYGVRAFSVHPGGIVTTNLIRHLPADQIKASGYVDDEGRPSSIPSRT